MNLTDHITLPDPEVYEVPWIMNDARSFIIATCKQSDLRGDCPLVLWRTQTEVEAKAVRDEIKVRMCVARALCAPCAKP